MWEILAVTLFLRSALATDVGSNLACNHEVNGLLFAHLNKNSSAFLLCRKFSPSSTRLRKRKVCPSNMIFDFVSQRCRQRKIHRRQPKFSIAILNNSCADGEICIGGAVCDRKRLRCLCPYGTIPQLETLSCSNTYSSYQHKNDRTSSTSPGYVEKLPSAPVAFLPNPSQTNAMLNFFGQNSFIHGNANLTATSPVQSAINGITNLHNGYNNSWHTMGVPTSAAAAKGLSHEFNHGDFSSHIGNQYQSEPAVSYPNFLTATPRSTSSNKVLKPVGDAFIYVPHNHTSSAQPTVSKAKFSLLHSLPLFVPSTTLLTTPTLGYLEPIAHAQLLPAPVQTIYNNYSSTISATSVRTSAKPDGVKVLYGGHKQSEVGVTCSLNTDCMIGAYCDGNTSPPSCRCLSTHVNIDRRCVRVIYPGQVGCHNDLQCQAAYNGTSCVDRICVCPSGFMEANDTCVLEAPTYARPGQNCSGGEICVAGSRCDIEGVCSCPVQKPLLRDGECVVQQVTRTATPGESCDEHTTCIHGSTCDNSTEVCICPIGHMVVEGHCQLLQAQLPITHPVTSLTPSSTMSDIASMHTTPSPAQFARSRTLSSLKSAVTVLKLKYGDLCRHGKDICTSGAVCIDSVCKCGSGYALSTNGWCEPFGFNQTGNSVDSVPTAQPFASYSSPVVDVAPFITAPPSKVVRHRFLGTKCRVNDVCIGGGECRTGICQCPDGLYERDGKCLRATQLPRAAPGETCKYGDVCTGGSICDNDSNTCICAAEHTIANGVCRSKDASPFSVPGKSCARGVECSGGSTCVQNICSCGADHYAEDGYCRHIVQKAVHIFGRKPPGGLPAMRIPQFVVLTFDDAVNGRTLPDYKELFGEVKYRNPNGCPIRATFFVSHEWTNYDAVQWLYQRGMEIASNSITHVSLEGADANRWLNEMDGQRRIIAKLANVQEESIIGMRAPQLALGGNEQFEMMTRAGFVYDNSMSVNPGVDGDPFWPQTLDYSVPWSCYDAQCPTNSFAGLWAVPLNQFYGSHLPQTDEFRRSSMIRAAVDLNTTVEQLVSFVERSLPSPIHTSSINRNHIFLSVTLSEARLSHGETDCRAFELLRAYMAISQSFRALRTDHTNMFMTNFQRSYTSNRAPFVLSLNADLLQLNGRDVGMQALQRFLEEVSYKNDVYVVTLKQLIQWMRSPLSLNQISQSEALRCTHANFNQYPAIPLQLCSRPNKCMYRTPGLGSEEHQFLTCSPCPDQYPWLNNPIGYAYP